jgi:hypothetical protein
VACSGWIIPDIAGFDDFAVSVQIETSPSGNRPEQLTEIYGSDSFPVRRDKCKIPAAAEEQFFGGFDSPEET